MRCVRLGVLVGFVGVAVAAQAAVSVASGPFFNSANGSRYYRITGGDWNQLRAFALSMGGDLASIEDAAENTWVRSNVVGTNSKPFIGLNDAGLEGTLVWSNGSTSNYRNWRVGEPSNSASKDYVRYDGQAAGTWEIVTVNFSPEAIVEIAASNGVPAPVRVPGEQPTLDSAFNIISAVGARQIDLAPGTYVVQNPYGIDGITLRGAGIGQTIVQGPTNPAPALALFNAARISDMTIVNRSSVASVAIVSAPASVTRVEFTSLPGTADGPLLQAAGFQNPALASTIDSCLFNTSSVAMDVDGGTLLIASSIFRDVGAVSAGGGGMATVRFANCLFTRCGPTTLFDSQNSNSVANSIFWDNSAPLNITTVSTSLVSAPGFGSNFTGDPRFVNAAANNFALLPDSPCVDRGSIAAYLACQPSDFLDFAGQPRAVDSPSVANAFAGASAIDVGPLEFVPAPCPGDLNSDGLVDDGDFQIFVVFYNQLLCP